MIVDESINGMANGEICELMLSWCVLLLQRVYVLRYYNVYVYVWGRTSSRGYWKFLTPRKLLLFNPFTYLKDFSIVNNLKVCTNNSSGPVLLLCSPCG